MLKNILYLGCLLAAVTADWTCQSCQEATEVGIESSLSENVLAYVIFFVTPTILTIISRAESDLLVGELCEGEGSGDDGYEANCAAFLPDFWRAIAGELYPVKTLL